MKIFILSFQRIILLFSILVVKFKLIKALNYENVFELLKLVLSKMNENDKVYTNIYMTDKWLTKPELFEFLNNSFIDCVNKSISFLNYQNILNLINYCLDVSNDIQGHMYSIILVNDMEEVDEDYFEGLRFISNKIKETKVSLMRGFTINTLLLRNEKENRSVSFFYDMCLLTMGYFYTPKVKVGLTFRISASL
jgi:hypothetical protein